jgi:hypothetical protein
VSTTFELDVSIDAPLQAVQQAFLDPDFYRLLGEMPAIDPPQLIERRDEGNLVHLKVRYRLDAPLPAAARRILDPARLTWVDESVVDVAANRTEFRMVPDHYPDRLSCEGSYELKADGSKTVQHLKGVLTVHVPLVGSMAERGILRGLQDHLAKEAELLARFVTERGGTR